MTNGFYNHTTPLTRHTIARAEAVNTELDAVAAAFDKLPAEARLKEGRVDYASSVGGTANAITVTLPHTVTYTEGLAVRFKAPSANTGAVTINVNSLGVKSIKRPNGDPLQSGDIAAGSIVELRYDGSSFRANVIQGLAAAAAASQAAAAASESNAAASATAAASSASSAAASAASSGASAEIATNKAGEAATSASNAAASATSSAASAEAAAGAAAGANTQAVIATAKAAEAAENSAAAAGSATAAAESQSAASQSEGNAAQSASDAAAAATVAVAGAASATSASTTSVTINTGLKNFTVATGKAFAPGMTVNAAYTPDPANYSMSGTVVSYNSGTGALAIQVSAATGSGALADWMISISGASGANGATWHYGSGVPSGSLGINGDLYKDDSAGDTYAKEAGVWVAKGNLMGPEGPPGGTSLTVISADHSAVNGDRLWVNTSGGEVAVALPSPVLNHRVEFANYGRSWETHALLVSGNIYGVSGDIMTVDTNITGFAMQGTGATWEIV